jgi:hypothetical protein
MNAMVSSREQGIAILKARTKAFRFAKGQSGNPDGQSRFYHEARMLARRASPEMMERLVELARSSEDDRVSSICAMAVLDRAGVRPIDFDPSEEKSALPAFNPRDYEPAELDVIEAALKIMVERRKRQREAMAAGSQARGPDEINSA